MPVFVAKFGGTSLADGERFQNVLNIVLKHPDRRFVVLSAPGKRARGDRKITDLLIACEEKKDKALFSEIRGRFAEISDFVGVCIKEALDEIEENIFSGAGKAYAASRGEYLSAMIFSKMSGFSFLDAKDAIFFKEGEVDEEKTADAISRAFRAKNPIVMPGFYGADERGQIRLFPRGGSDTSGAIAAFALGAERYENWTDVDGIFKSDPKLDPDQSPIPCLSYDEAGRILSAGASVLHPDCLYWARKKGTPIFVRNTFRAHLTGTRIGHFMDKMGAKCPAI